MKTKVESNIQFTTRLRALLKCYLESRNITDSFQQLFELLLVDRYLDSLSPEARYFVADKQGDEVKTVQQLALWMDAYEAEREHVL